MAQTFINIAAASEMQLCSHNDIHGLLLLLLLLLLFLFFFLLLLLFLLLDAALLLHFLLFLPLCLLPRLRPSPFLLSTALILVSNGDSFSFFHRGNIYGLY